MTLDDIQKKKWVFKEHKDCFRCGESIEKWTTPSGNDAYLNPMNRGTDQVVFHSNTCEGK